MSGIKFWGAASPLPFSPTTRCSRKGTHNNKKAVVPSSLGQETFKTCFQTSKRFTHVGGRYSGHKARKKERKKENQFRQFILIHMTTNP
jgi:hypothetical protein